MSTETVLTLELAKAHLRKTTDEQDDLIMRLLNEARDIVLDYLKLDADTYEDETDTGLHTVPNIVCAAILRVLEALYAGNHDEQVLSQAVRDVLHRSRDPALA